MAWSISLIGTPADISSELASHSQSLIGDSKAEFDEALPHLQGLVNQNLYPDETGSSSQALHLSASGHASKTDGKKYQSSCHVSIQPSFTRVVHPKPKAT